MMLGAEENYKKTIFSIKDFDSKEEEWILNGLDSGRDKINSN